MRKSIAESRKHSDSQEFRHHWEKVERKFEMRRRRRLVEFPLLAILFILAMLPQSCSEAHAAPIGAEGILERVPPSRPEPMWDQPLLRPYFDNSTDYNIIGAVGRTIFLHCRVKHLGDRAVTWIRKQDVHVLTVGLFTYTTDDRFTALHSEGSDDWTLRISPAQVADSGTYECQVSTEPKISRSFELQVVDAQAHISGPGEIHMVSGSNINLTCAVTGSLEPPQYMYWYRGMTLINYSSRGGISVVTDKNSRTSRLVVTRAAIADSGNYTCAPANAEPASVYIYILSGEHPEAMQGGESTSIHCQSFVCLPLFSFFVLRYHSFAVR